MVIAGNVTEDRVPGGWRPGGPALYSALTANALGADVKLITRLAPTFDRSILDGVDVRSYPAAHMPRYENTYNPAGDRRQRLLDPGEALEPAMLVCDGKADAFILAPSYHEIDRWPFPCANIRAVALQSLLRSTDAEHHIVPSDRPIEIARAYAHRGVIAFLSEEDTPDAEALASDFASMNGTMAIVTRGYRGAVRFAGEERTEYPAAPATPVDPTGAGDCFSTAYIVRLGETRDHEAAMEFALAAGALAVEAEGIAGIPTRAAIERRLGMVAA